MKIHSILFTRSKQWLKTSLVQCTQLRDFISRTRRISRSAPYYCFKNLSCLPYHSCGNVKLEVSFHKPDGLVKRVELLQQLPYFRQPSVTVYTQKRCQLFQAGNVFQAWFGGGGVPFLQKQTCLFLCLVSLQATCQKWCCLFIRPF